MVPQQPAIFEIFASGDFRVRAPGGIRRWLLIAACLAWSDVGTACRPAAAAPPGCADNAVQREFPREQRPKADPNVAITAVTDDPARQRVELTGLTPQLLAKLGAADLDAESWSRLFSVRVAADGLTAAPAMFGRYRIADGKLFFKPRFPFQPGVQYQAAFDPASLPAGLARDGKAVTYVFTIPKSTPPAATFVQQIYPTQNELPENLLKFYIHFSAPMSRGEAYERIRLLDASGKRIEYPFLELAEELWNADGTRFTLLFDPGRIKQGLKPREDVGSPLQADKSFTLVVDRKWSDASGNRLKASLQKQFRVVERDDTQPDPGKWKLSVPSADSTEPFEILFNEPLDHAMLQRVLVVQDSRGRAITGRIEIDRQETRWRFHPQTAWQSGEYRLVVDTALEDVAGNSIGRPFEVDLRNSEPRQTVAESITLPFTVKARR